MKSSQKGFKLPNGLQIGERFLLSFNDPDLTLTPQLGRLQDLSADGALCIDVPAELRPPRGTPVIVSSLRQNDHDCRFSSEILGRQRLNGRLPVLLVKAPDTVEKLQRRTSFRISVALKARAQWENPEDPGQVIGRPAVVTNLSGTGAQVFVRQLPAGKTLDLFLPPPDVFVEEWAMRKLARGRTQTVRPSIFSDPFQEACAEIRASFGGIKVRIIRTRTRSQDSRGSVHVLSVAFAPQHEGCYRLAFQEGIGSPAQLVPTAA